MSAVILIPARLASTRLERKLLLPLGGKSVLQRTYEQARKARRATRVVIATDAPEIFDHARTFGADVVMTRADHQSGTERIAEAATSIEAEIFVNIQGDEPEIDPAHIDELIETQETARLFASTLACPFPLEIDPEYPSAVKAIVGKKIGESGRIYEARDFRRKLLPLQIKDAYFLHIGAYAFSSKSLKKFAETPPGQREQQEKLEQLRILELGEKIAVRIIDRSERGIDTLVDYEASVARMSR